MAYGTVNADVIGTSVANSNLGAGNATRFKNRIINGDMRIDQRNAGAAVTYNGVEAVYNIDRWQAGAIGGGAFTVQQSSTAPAGFTTSQKYTVTTADASIASTDRYSMYQYIEGYNVSDLGFGTANAKTFTVSFWIQSNVTGQYGVSIYNEGFDRAITNPITINSANTWEYKSVTFTADTSGTWNTTNGVGLRMAVSFAMGSSYQGTANTWTAGFITATSSQVNWMATNGNTLYITGVQLEVGSSATGFDYRDITTELVMCQRYFEKSVNQGTSITANSQVSWIVLVPSTTVATSVTYGTKGFIVIKRTTPTMTIYPYTTATNTTRVSNDSGGDLAANSGNVNVSSDESFSINNTSGGTLTTGAQLLIIANWYASAEL